MSREFGQRPGQILFPYGSPNLWYAIDTLCYSLLVEEQEKAHKKQKQSRPQNAKTDQETIIDWS